jgi:hypothetical protein
VERSGETVLFLVLWSLEHLILSFLFFGIVKRGSKDSITFEKHPDVILRSLPLEDQRFASWRSAWQAELIFGPDFCNVI